MDLTLQPLMKRAYATPGLRQNILNKGKLYLYCDYSGHDERKECGLACCLVHNRIIDVTARKIMFDRLGDSVYGELLAILYSLEALANALSEHRPKFAILYTDCSYITRLLSKDYYFTKALYEGAINQIRASLNDLEIKFPEVEVSVEYMRQHKKNNLLHRMAHIAARKVIGK